MESHVIGGSTPLSSGELRRDLLAVLIGNSLFTQAEQLRANHSAHECDCPRRLALWLRNVQREAARRQRVNELQRQAHCQVVDYSSKRQISELQELANCPALTELERGAIGLLPVQNASCLRTLLLVGGYYVTALRRVGKLPEYGA